MQPPFVFDGPYGTPLEADMRRFGTVLLIAQGVGVVPFASALKSIEDDHQPLTLKKVLVYWIGNGCALDMFEDAQTLRTEDRRLDLVLRMTNASDEVGFCLYEALRQTVEENQRMIGVFVGGSRDISEDAQLLCRGGRFRSRLKFVRSDLDF